MKSKISYTVNDANKLASGQTLGDIVEITFNTTTRDDFSSFVVERATSLDGTTETSFFRADDTFSVVANYIVKIDLPVWESFFYSVKIGEPFNYFVNENDVTPVSCRMQSDNYSPIRTGLIDDEFSFDMQFIAI